MLGDRTTRPSVRQIAAPKRGGVRLLTMLDPATQGRYVSLVAAAAPAIEARLTPAVIANRVRQARVRPPRLELEPTAEARDRFVRMALALCRAPFVLVSDVENCYPAIAPEVVGAALERSGVRPPLVRELLGLLAELSPFGVRGLPVGPPPSAVLANAVLATVDEALAGAGRRHIRWVDDVWVAAASRTDAEETRWMLRDALDGLGLRVSVRKTRIAASGDVRPDGVSAATSEYHRRAHAHPLPGVARPDVVAPRRG